MRVTLSLTNSFDQHSVQRRCQSRRARIRNSKKIVIDSRQVCDDTRAYLVKARERISAR